MDGLPVTIRLLDPPLHEFLPHTAGRDRRGRARRSARPSRRSRAKVAELTEANPMLGHRGCRLAITYPEIYEIQVRRSARPRPQVARRGRRGPPRDHDPARDGARGAAPAARAGRRPRSTRRSAARRSPYTIGTMIELPRACVVADRIAEHADFFSFGTNDLTQTTFGLSRDDAGRFLPAYVDAGRAARRPVRGARPRRRRRADRARGPRRPARPSPASRSGSAASTAASRSSVEFCHRAGLRLRVLLAVPGADRAGRGGARGAARAE